MKETFDLLLIATLTTGGLLVAAFGVIGAAFGVTKTFAKN